MNFRPNCNAGMEGGSKQVAFGVRRKPKVEAGARAKAKAKAKAAAKAKARAVAER